MTVWAGGNVGPRTPSGTGADFSQHGAAEVAGATADGPSRCSDVEGGILDHGATRTPTGRRWAFDLNWLPGRAPGIGPTVRWTRGPSGRCR